MNLMWAERDPSLENANEVSGRSIEGLAKAGVKGLAKAGVKGLAKAGVKGLKVGSA